MSNKLPTPLGSTKVGQSLKNDLNSSGKWNQISFADNTKQITSNASPGLYARERGDKWIIKGLSTAADRYTIKSPIKLHAEVNGELHVITSAIEYDLSVAATWDTLVTDYTVAANRAGKDFYIYVIDNSGTTLIEFSANSTVPDGYTAATSRKIGGFHCLCVAVGTISGHFLTNFVAGDVLPATIWDYDNRPISATEGMFLANSGMWIDIYLPSVSGGELVSVYNGTIADGVSTEKFHAYKFEQWLARIGKKPISQVEFVDASIGSNQGANINGTADPGTTGGHSDTASRRMISDGGGEDMCGAMWQWGRDAGGLTGGATWRNAFDGNDSNVAGQHSEDPFRPRLGGDWGNGARCGSRGSKWNISALTLDSGSSSRGVAEPKN